MRRRGEGYNHATSAYFEGDHTDMISAAQGSKLAAKSFAQWAVLRPRERPPLSVVRITTDANDRQAAASNGLLPVFDLRAGCHGQLNEREAALKYFWFLTWGLKFNVSRSTICTPRAILGLATANDQCICEVIIDRNGVPLTGWLSGTRSAFQTRARVTLAARAASFGYHLWRRSIFARLRHAQLHHPEHLRNDIWLSSSSCCEAWESRLSYHASRDGVALCASCCGDALSGDTLALFPLQGVLAVATVLRMNALPPSTFQTVLQRLDRWTASLSSSRHTMSWMELLVASQSLTTVSFAARRPRQRKPQADRAAQNLQDMLDADVDVDRNDSLKWGLPLRESQDLSTRVVGYMSTIESHLDYSSMEQLVGDAASRALELLVRLVGEELDFHSAQRFLSESLFLLNFVWTFQMYSADTFLKFEEASKMILDSVARFVQTIACSRVEQQRSVGNPRELASTHDMHVDNRTVLAQSSSVAQSGALLRFCFSNRSALCGGHDDSFDSGPSRAASALSSVAKPFRRTCHEFLVGGVPDYDVSNYLIAQMSSSLTLLLRTFHSTSTLALASALQELSHTSLWSHYASFGYFGTRGTANDTFLNELRWLSVPSAAICAIAPLKGLETSSLLCLDFGEDVRVSPMGLQAMALLYRSSSASFTKHLRPMRLALVCAGSGTPQRPVATPSGILDLIDVVQPWVQLHHHSSLRSTLGGLTIALQAADRLHDSLLLLASCGSSGGVVANALRASLGASIGLIIRKQRVVAVVDSADKLAESFHRELLSSRVKMKR